MFMVYRGGQQILTNPEVQVDKAKRLLELSDRGDEGAGYAVRRSGTHTTFASMNWGTGAKETAPAADVRKVWDAEVRS